MLSIFPCHTRRNSQSSLRIQSQTGQHYGVCCISLVVPSSPTTTLSCSRHCEGGKRQRGCGCLQGRYYSDGPGIYGGQRSLSRLGGSLCADILQCLERPRIPPEHKQTSLKQSYLQPTHNALSPERISVLFTPVVVSAVMG